MKVIPVSGRSPGLGSDNPLQYSHLEDSMVRGAWQAIIYGVSKSWAWWAHTHSIMSKLQTIIWLCRVATNVQFIEKKKKKAISAKPDKAKCNKARYACILSHFTLLWFLISFTPPQLSLIFPVAIIVITWAQSWDSGPLQASPRCHCYAMWLSKSTSPVTSVSSSV